MNSEDVTLTSGAKVLSNYRIKIYIFDEITKLMKLKELIEVDDVIPYARPSLDSWDYMLKGCNGEIAIFTSEQANQSNIDGEK